VGTASRQKVTAVAAAAWMRCKLIEGRGPGEGGGSFR
jgi:hypothetical protein